ncbi:MAG: DNA polymerase [Phycisphaerales bacterium]|nr:DNA polymerase [Phycisphaerales bacterium]
MPLSTIYIDMNSYFASIEQQAHPELRGKPVAVVPLLSDATCCIAASYEAKRFGIRTGTNVGEAKRLCPGLICVTGNFELYVQQHHQIIAAIDTQIPVQGVHSIDEMSARLMGDEKEPAKAIAIAKGIKKAIREKIGAYATCSIGIAPNRFLAKIAADMHKPDGLTVIEPHELPHKLFTLDLIDLPGIGRKMKPRLEAAGITSVEILCTADEDTLAKAWGSIVGREWYMRLRGHDAKEVKIPPRTIGHSHVLGMERRNEEGARAVGIRLANKVAARARHLGYIAEHLSLFIRYRDPIRALQREGTKSWDARLALGAVNDTTTIVNAFTQMWSRRPPGVPVQLGVTLTDLTTTEAYVGPLFTEQNKLADLSKAMDAISRKFGADAIYQASMQEAKKSAPRRIAFGNIPDLDLPDIQS